MKFKLLFSLLVCLFSFFPLFAVSKEAPAKTTESTQQRLQDHDALALLAALDQNEINAAKEALKKSKDPQVREFAKSMEKDHGANLKATQKLAHKMKTDTK